MALRLVDKKIKILELICKNDFREDCISNIEIKETSDDELMDILKDLQNFNLLKICNTDLISIPDESHDNEIVAYYQLVNKEKIRNLLKKMRDKYPKLKEPIIRERPLKKIAKHLSNIETKDEVVVLLKEWGVPRILIERQYVESEMIFRVLNHYVFSAKKEDFSIFKKIIENFVQLLMFDGDKKEAQGMADMLNGLLEYDGFVIKNGGLERIENLKKETKSTPNKKVGNSFSGNLTIETSLEKLASYNDGTIRYAGETIAMRSQINDLCRFFMANSSKLLTIDDIKEEIIRANKRRSTPNATIAKYVSELNGLLSQYFNKDVIFNQKKEGWLMKI